MANFNPFAGESQRNLGAVTASNSSYPGTPPPPTSTPTSPTTPSNNAGGTPISTPQQGGLPNQGSATNPPVDNTFGASSISAEQLEKNRQELIAEGKANSTLNEVQNYKPKTQIQKDQETFQSNLDTKNKEIQDIYKKPQDLFTQFQNGSIPLTSNQKDLLNIMSTNMQSATTAQERANKDYTAGMEQMGAAAGRNRYAPEIEAGNIYNSIQMGISKVTELQNEYLQKKYEMQESMQDGNYTKMMDSYKIMLDNEKDQRDTMIAMEKMTRDYNTQQQQIAYNIQQDALNRKQTMTLQGYSYISNPKDLAGLTEDQIVRIGNDIYKKPTTTNDASNDIKDYEYAKNSGFTGSFMDYLSEKANLKEDSGPTDSQVLSYAKYLQTKDEENGIFDKTSEDYMAEARGMLSSKSDASNLKDNEKTDLECGEYINQTAGVLVGQHWKEKKENVSNYGTLGSSGIKVGDVVYQDVKTEDGHVALVTAVNDDGSVVVDEANYKNDGKVSKGRVIQPKDIYGYIDPSKATDLKIDKGSVEGATKDYSSVLKKNQNTLIASIPPTERSTFMKGLLKSAQTGDKKQIKEAIYSGIIENSKSGKDLSIQDSKVQAFNGIKEAFEKYYNDGGDTNVIKGSFNNLLNKIGQTSDPKLQELKANIITARMKFRNEITGAAWGIQEDGEYNTIIGGITSSKEKNLSGVNGALTSLKSDMENRIKKVVGDDIYNEFFKESNSKVEDLRTKYNY